MKISKLLKLFAFFKGFQLLTHRPVRKAGGGLLKKYILWKLYRRR